MNIDASSLSGLTSTLGKFFHRFGFIVIFLIIAAGLVVSIFLLGDVIAKTDNPGDYTPSNITTSFDKETMDRLKNLSQKSTVDTDGRLLPFW